MGTKFCHDLFARVADRFNLIKVAVSIKNKVPFHHELHEQAQIEFEELKHTFLTNLEQIINDGARPELKSRMLGLARELVSEVMAMVKNDLLIDSDEDAERFDYEAEEDDDDEAEEASGFVHHVFAKCGQILELLKIASEYFKFKLKNEQLPKLTWDGFPGMRREYEYLITNELPTNEEYTYTYAKRRHIAKLVTLLKNHAAFEYFETQYNIRKSKHWELGYDTAFEKVSVLQGMKKNKISTDGVWDAVVIDALHKLEVLNNKLLSASIK